MGTASRLETPRLSHRQQSRCRQSQRKEDRMRVVQLRIGEHPSYLQRPARCRRFAVMLTCDYALGVVLFFGRLGYQRSRGERLKPGLQRWSPGFSRSPPMSLFALGSLLELLRFGLAAESCGGISPSIVDPPVLLGGFSDALFESIVVPLR